MARKYKSDYAQKLLDPRWQKMRLKVYERDNFKCTNCGEGHITLTAHHTYYENNLDPWDYPVTSIVTLCNRCHTNYHKHSKVAYEGLVKSISRCGFGIESLRDIQTGFDMLSQINNKSCLGNFSILLAFLISDENLLDKVAGELYASDPDAFVKKLDIIFNRRGDLACELQGD